MPTVLITPEALIKLKGPWEDLLREAGFCDYLSRGHDLYPRALLGG